jgi:hypothetical protein
MAWLSVIIIQAIVYFGFLSRNEELKEEGRNEKLADQEGEAPLKTQQWDSFRSAISTASSSESTDAVTAAGSFEDSLFETDSDSDLKFRIQNGNSEIHTVRQTEAEMSSSCPILSAGGIDSSNTSDVIAPSNDSGSFVEEDDQSSIEENISDSKSCFERQTSLDTEDSSYFATSKIDNNSNKNSQDESEPGLVSKSRSHNEESFSTLVYDFEYECDDCDIIDEDDEWRLQLLKDYYENATDILMPVDNHSNVTTGRHEHAFVSSNPVSAQ